MAVNIEATPLTAEEEEQWRADVKRGAGGQWGAVGVLALLDASRAREKALVEALRPFARYAELQHFNARQRRVLMGIRSSEGTAEITSVHFLAVMRAIAPYSAPTEPEAPSDVHPQECGQ